MWGVVISLLSFVIEFVKEWGVGSVCVCFCFSVDTKSGHDVVRGSKWV